MDVNYSNNEKYLIADFTVKLSINACENNANKIYKALSEGLVIASGEFNHYDLIYFVGKEEPDIGKLFVYGGLIYTRICEYADFLHLLNQLQGNAERFSSKLLKIAMQTEKDINENSIVHLKTGTGITAEIQTIITRLENLEINWAKENYNSITNDTNILLRKLSNILALLNIDERMNILHVLPAQIKNILPEPNKKEMDTLYDIYFLKPDQIKSSNKNRHR